jgi:predicted lipid-binding transport protein (Tim44 family)
LSIVHGLMAVFFGAGVVATWWAVRRRQKRVAEVERAAVVADAGDGYWHPHALHERIREAFFPIQLSWERRDVSASRPFVSDALYERHAMQLKGYEEQHRVNRIEDLTLGRVEIVRLHNVTDDGEDRFVARIECTARDWMEDTRTGAVVNGNRDAPTDFVQFWSFCRHPEYGWVLDEIQQDTEGGYHLSAPLVNADDGPLDGAPDTVAPGPPAP